MNLQIMNQAKNDFLNNNDIEKAIWYYHYTVKPGATLVLFTQNQLKPFFYIRMKFISTKRNDEIECPCCCA